MSVVISEDYNTLPVDGEGRQIIKINVERNQLTVWASLWNGWEDVVITTGGNWHYNGELLQVCSNEDCNAVYYEGDLDLEQGDSTVGAGSSWKVYGSSNCPKCNTEHTHEVSLGE
jgi:hypothetical protein